MPTDTHAAAERAFVLAEQEARALCDRSLLKEWVPVRPGKVIGLTVILWAQLLGAWAAALAGPPLLWIPAFVVICACVSAMQLWVHDSSHYTLFRRRWLNDLWATIFFGSPIGMSIHTYRRYHMTHHRHLGTHEDMDRFAFDVNVTGRRALVTVLLRGLLCIEGFRIIAAKYLAPAPSGSRAPRDWTLLATLAWNGALLAACVLAGRWYLYPILWAYPIVGVVVTINLLRSIGEHQPAGFIGPVAPDEAITPVTRTTLPGALEKWLVFQANFNYHFEHHLYPSVPAVNLRRLHRHLAASGFYRRHPELLQRSGVARVFALSRAPSGQGATG